MVLRPFAFVSREFGELVVWAGQTFGAAFVPLVTAAGTLFQMLAGTAAVRHSSAAQSLACPPIYKRNLTVECY